MRRKMGPDKQNIITKVSPVVTNNEYVVNSMRVGTTCEDIVVVDRQPGLLLMKDEERHRLGGAPGIDGDDIACGGVPDDVGGCVMKNSEMCTCVQKSCVRRMPSKAKFGETLDPEPHGDSAKAPSVFTEKRFGDPDVLATTSCVQPGENQGEARGNLLKQSQIDTDVTPHGEHSRIG